MTETPAPAKCPVKVSNGGRSASFHTCGRPVKDDGMCGVHLAAQRKRAERDAADAAYAAKKQTDEATRAAAAALAAEGVDLIGANLGVPHFRRVPFAYTGALIVPADVLRALIDLARKGQQS